MESKEGISGEFCKVVREKYINECLRESVEPTFNGMVSYLFDRNIIPLVTVRRVIVLERFPRALWQNNGRKRAAIQQVEDETGVCERAVWSIVGGAVSGKQENGRPDDSERPAIN